MKTSTPPAKPKPSPPLPLPPGATDEDRFVWLLGCAAIGIFSQFETHEDQQPTYDYSGGDPDRSLADDYDADKEEDYDWEEKRSEHLAQRSAMAAGHLMAEFHTHREFSQKC